MQEQPEKATLPPYKKVELHAAFRRRLVPLPSEEVDAVSDATSSSGHK